MKWELTAIILCAYGLFKEFRPSEPFVTQFLIRDKNITLEQIVHEAFPVSTYSNLVTLVIVFIVTDFLRYRLVIIFGGCAYVACWILLIWGEGLLSLIIVEAFYGLAFSTEVAYHTYIYTKVDKKNFKKVTSYTHAANQIGRFLSGVVAQLMVKRVGYMGLTYMSLASVSVALGFSIMLPRVHQSLYFYRDGDEDLGKSLSLTERIAKAYPVLWRDFRNAYTNKYVLKWCIWWSLASAGYSLVLNYVQAVWEIIADSSTNEIYNGYVEAIHTLLSAILAFGIGYTKIPWFKWGEIMLFLTALLQGGTLIWTSQTGNIFIAYACYNVFRLLFQVMITVAMSEVAQNISEDSWGLIIGVNSFLALAIQSVATFVITDSKGLALPAKTQFLVYGSGFIILAIFFFIVATVKLFTKTEEAPLVCPLGEEVTSAAIDVGDANVTNRRPSSQEEQSV